MKPLFIPLKSEYYETFKDGSKAEELRLFGPRWNHETCIVGREVILSKGYGKQNRMKGVIWKFKKQHGSSFGSTYQAAIQAVYGTLDIEIACISIMNLKPIVRIEEIGMPKNENFEEGNPGKNRSYEENLCLGLLSYAAMSCPRSQNMKSSEIRAGIAVFFGGEMVKNMVDVLIGEGVTTEQTECPKGGAHEYGIDGMHSNVFCKKCFEDKRQMV